MQTSRNKGDTTTCPQCKGRGWRFPGFWSSPLRILKFAKFVVATLAEETFGFSGCRACDKKGSVPREWLEGEE
jgi:hypothetical protein